MSYSDFNSGEMYFGGGVSDVVGTLEHYDTRIERTLMTPTGELSLPSWANDSAEIRSMFYVGVAENWTLSRYLKEIAKTSAFTERYPAFGDMLTMTNGDHESALENYKEYEYEIQLLKNRYSEDVSVKDLTNQAIKKGYSIEDIKRTFDVFERAEQNADSLIAFQSIVDASGINFSVLDAQGMVDFFEGSAPTEIYDLYEASSIAEQARKFELTNMSAEEALAIAKSTPGQLQQQQINANLQAAAQQIARFRQYIDLEKYGLTADDITNAALGYIAHNDEGDRVGLSEYEIATAMARIIGEDEDFGNLASGVSGSQAFKQKQRQVRSIG